MRVAADLHIHSHYSIATSPKLTPSYLDRWARVKGIDLLGTGDCTHPAWLAELKSQLEPAEEGLFRLKEDVRRGFDAGEALARGLPDPGEERRQARFVLTGEISTIYSRDGRTRKVHHVVLLPDFAAAAAFQARLEQVGNIGSDGRPILGLDSRDLFALLLDADDRSILVPAHIWTPWFSCLGARSGFDSVEECYGDLSTRIGAIETGLSSNPPMNWAVSALNRYAIISNSDAHSPEKIGREATILDMELSYTGLAQALSGGPRSGVLETIEFFPQEGKYHYDGHRACSVVLSPAEAANGLCPVCGKPLTPGVLRRVMELADSPVEETAPCPETWAGTNRRPYRSLIPLKEILGELGEAGEGSKRVAAAYNGLIHAAGCEFSLLLDMDPHSIEGLDIPGISGGLLAEAIVRMRSGRVSIQPGYDGEYGVIRAFAPGERLGLKSQGGLFGRESDLFTDQPKKDGPRAPAAKARERRPPSSPAALGTTGPEPNPAAMPGASPFQLDPRQEEAVDHPGGPALVLAGPGTGKTAVLALRIARLVEAGADPASILAITFTNKAAKQLKERIARALGEREKAALTASTFHAFCLSILRERAADAGLPPGFRVLGEEERSAFLERAAGTSPRRLAAYIENRKRLLLLPGERLPRLGPGAPPGLMETLSELGLPELEPPLDTKYKAYRESLKAAEALDFDDLISGTVRLLASRPDIAAEYRDRYRLIFVDEYQDVNFAQYALIRFLAPGDSNPPNEAAAIVSRRELFVIGDPNQAIYAFRGADSRFIERFRTDYPQAAVYTLSRSFRCAPAILDAAGRLVGAALEGSGAAVALWRSDAPTERAEAEGIAREIDRLIGGTRFFALDSGTAGDAAEAAEEEYAPGGGAAALRSLGECAVLVRTSALTPPIAKALRDHGIPYRLIGEIPWWEEEPCRSTLRLLREASGNAAGAPRPVSGDSPAEDLRARLAELSPREAVYAAAAILSGPAAARGSGRAEKRPGAAKSPEGPEDTLERLALYAENYKDTPAFLDSLALASPQDGYELRGEAVSLMTIHAAKGLEFDHVFIPGLEEGILPFTLFEREESGEADSSIERIEEERRLLYVAITRARVGLHLWRARSRTLHGRRLDLPPSRFLAEIEDLIPRKKEGPRSRRDPQLGLF